MRTFRAVSMLVLGAGFAICLFILCNLRGRVDEIASSEVLANERSIAAESSSQYAFDAVCANRVPGRNWCALDFTRLAVHSSVMQGKRLYMLGYLAIDHGGLVLYATEADYTLGEAGRSLQLLGRRADLEQIFSKFGNKYLRIEGTFDSSVASVQRAGRLGALHAPFQAVPWVPRAEREGVDDLTVHVMYMSDDSVDGVKEKTP